MKTKNYEKVIKISLRVFGENLDFKGITRLLGVEPTFSARKGDRVGRLKKIQSTDVWGYGLRPKGSRKWELQDALDTLLSRFPVKSLIWRKLTKKYKVDVFCGLFLHSQNEVITLHPETLKKFADRYLVLSLDIYDFS